MSQVHSVTHVPVHSPLSEACLPYSCASAHQNYGVGVAGGNGPQRWGAEANWGCSEGGDLLLRLTVLREQAMKNQQPREHDYSVLRTRALTRVIVFELDFAYAVNFTTTWKTK
jgi:hypothetical protein